MRRRVQPPSDGETAATAKTSKERAQEALSIPLGKASVVAGAGGSAPGIKKRRRELSLKHFSFLLGMLIIFASIYFLLKIIFPKHRYHHLLEIPEIKKLLEDAPAPIHDEYVVFVSNANGKHPYNVAFARSLESAEHALRSALTKMPLISARYPWFKIDIVTASKVMTDYDSASKDNNMPSWWYGLAMDWANGWVFLPDEVRAHGLADYKNRLQWDRLTKYVASRNLIGWPKTVAEDDSTQLSELEVLHTNAIFCDFSNKQVVPLYHGHRMYEKLTHSILMEAAHHAGDYLARSVHADGRMVYVYKPTSDSEPKDYGLTRHAGAVYSMAVLYAEYHNDALQKSMKRALDFLLTFVNECPLPYDPTRSQKCLWDYTVVRFQRLCIGEKRGSVLVSRADLFSHHALSIIFCRVNTT
jgi:hypothetical protein